MNIETIDRKLEPLKPRTVQHWLNVRDTADDKLKALIDRQIVVTAQQVLGDYRRKILLSLPPAKTAKGSIHLGTVLYEKEKWPVGISQAELLQNLAIFGRSGAGKTNVAFHILQQLTEKKIPFLFLDWKRTGRHLLPLLRGKPRVYTPGRSLSPFPFNPFIPPPGLEPQVYINQVVDVMADAYTLGDGARSILHKAIDACYQKDNYAPSVDEVLGEVETIPEKERIRGWKISAVRALESIAFAKITPKDRITQHELAEQLLHQSTIVELNGLSASSKQFLIPLLCLWLYYVRLASPTREQLSLVMLVEEAHHVLHRSNRPSRETVMEMLLRQCREIGIAMIVVDQHPHLISAAATGNTYTSICLNLKDPSDINRAAALSLVKDEDKDAFSTLPVGQGIVKLQDRWRQPFLVAFPLMPIKKGLMTDDLLREYQAGSVGIGAVKGTLGQVRQIQLEDHVLNEQALRFLKDVCDNPDDGVKVRYERLELSVGTGNKLKQQLVQHGWLEAAIIPVGQSRKVILRLAERARELLGLDSHSPRHESIAHEYWKNFYGRLLEGRGFRVQLEAPRKGGNVDVLAQKGAERLGIEIETGKSTVVANVKNCLRTEFDRVIVVATDEAALAKVEQLLATDGLLIPDRVEVVLREQLGPLASPDGMK